MILTGKAKEDFIKWVENQSNYTNNSNHLIKYENSESGEFLWYGNETDLLKESKFLNALIIEWFDLMEYKGKRMYSDFFYFYWEYRIPSQSFNDICIQTIEMCNKFYNTLEHHQLPD